MLSLIPNSIHGTRIQLNSGVQVVRNARVGVQVEAKNGTESAIAKFRGSTRRKIRIKIKDVNLTKLCCLSTLNFIFILILLHYISIQKLELTLSEIVF